MEKSFFFVKFEICPSIILLVSLSNLDLNHSTNLSKIHHGLKLKYCTRSGGLTGFTNQRTYGLNWFCRCQK